MRKNSFDQFKKYPSSSSAKTPHYAMAQSLAVRFKSRWVNWRLPYHSYAFFLWPPSFGGIPGDFLRIAGLTSIVRKALCRMSTRAA